MIRTIAIGLAATALLAGPALAQRDGTPGNPPGTAAGRAVDRATGSNTTGANPNHGTGVSRAPMKDTPRGNTTGTTTAPMR
jgi:hypothetical protein